MNVNEIKKQIENWLAEENDNFDAVKRKIAESTEEDELTEYGCEYSIILSKIQCYNNCLRLMEKLS